MTHNQARSTPQEAFNLQRASQVYGTRALIPVTSKAAPSLDYYNAQEKRR